MKTGNTGKLDALDNWKYLTYWQTGNTGKLGTGERKNLNKWKPSKYGKLDMLGNWTPNWKT